jgi:hypothetical protein
VNRVWSGKPIPRRRRSGKNLLPPILFRSPPASSLHARAGRSSAGRASPPELNSRQPDFSPPAAGPCARAELPGARPCPPIGRSSARSPACRPSRPELGQPAKHPRPLAHRPAARPRLSARLPAARPRRSSARGQFAAIGARPELYSRRPELEPHRSATEQVILGSRSGWSGSTWDREAERSGAAFEQYQTRPK